MATAVPNKKKNKRPNKPGLTRSGSISGAGVSARKRRIVVNIYAIYLNPANKSVSGVLTVTLEIANW